MSDIYSNTVSIPVSISLTCRVENHNLLRTHKEGTGFGSKILLSKFYSPTDAQWSCFKRILKFTLKQLLHVSVQSASSGSVLFELAKVIY
jgi:hypothetical protein